MIKTFKYRFLMVFCVLTFIGFSTISGAQAQECENLDKVLVLYGQNVCPDRFNQEDDFKRWDKMTANLPNFLPGAGSEEKKTAPELCEHLRLLKRLYAYDAEVMMGRLGNSLGTMAAKGDNEKLIAYLDKFKESRVEPENLSDTAVINTLIRGDQKQLNELLSFFDERVQVKILMVKEMVDKAVHLTLLQDSALDTCSAYAKEKKYYKNLNYNGPDAGYDPNSPEEAPKWEALRKKWDAAKAKEAAE